MRFKLTTLEPDNFVPIEGSAEDNVVSHDDKVKR